MMSSIKFLRPTGLIWAFYNVSFIIILAFGPDFLMAQGWHTEAASAMVSTTSWMLILGVPLGAWLADRIRHPDLTIIACSIASALLMWAHRYSCLLRSASSSLCLPA
jgi:predicted MFS family arabinose efflux permease